MDHEVFDRLTQKLGAMGTRRAALAGLFGAGVLAGAPAAETKRTPRGRGKARVRAQAQPGLHNCPNPGPGKNLSRCDFSGADLTRVNLQGANLSGASFARANLRGADLGGANLNRADFERADLCAARLNGANLNKSDISLAVLQRANLRGARLVIPSENPPKFCQTIMPNGSINNANCSPIPTAICCFNEECVPVFGFPRRCDRGECCVASGVNIGTFPRFLCCSREKEPDGKCI